MNTILITGTTGFVGSALARALRPGNRIVELNRRTFQTSPDRFAWDFRSPLPGGLPKRANIVIHAAAENSASTADCFAVNTAATSQLLEYAQTAGVEVFVYLSTGSVYGNSNGPHQETDPVCPHGPYACTKAAGENVVRAYQHCFRTLTLRLYFPYGPGQRKERLIPRLNERIARGDAIQIKGSSGPAVSPLYIDDLTTWVSRLLTGGVSGTFNLAGSDRVTIRELAEKMGTLLDVPVRFDHQVGNPVDLVGDASEIERITGRSPTWTLDAGLTHFIQQSGLAAPAGAHAP